MIGIVMGSTSDWDTMKAAAKILEEFGVPYEARAMSAHRTPELVSEWAGGAAKRGLKCIIANMPRRPPQAKRQPTSPTIKVRPWSLASPVP